MLDSHSLVQCVHSLASPLTGTGDSHWAGYACGQEPKGIAMPSILVVDDEDQIPQLIRDTFERAGYTVHEASDGKQALQQYRAEPADLVVMDILMPDQDGLESIMTLRREYPSVKVIAITGGTDMIGILNFLDIAKMLGARRTLQKPFDMQALLEAAKAELSH